MQCLDCGCNLTKNDLLVASCQSCGEPLLPDDLNELRDELGIEAAKPPEIINPIIQSKPLEIPDSVECPGCFTSLMGIDLEKWRMQGSCNYCSEVNPVPNSSAFSANDTTLTTAPVALPPMPMPDTLPFIINVGPSVGEIIHIPTGEIGRTDFHQILTDSWYKDHINRISSEHLHLDENYMIIDLGSTNKTYIDGKRVSGTQPIRLELGSDLNIGGNIQLTRSDNSGITALIEHVETGIKWHVPKSLESYDIKWMQHLGRLTVDDNYESWYRMADLHLRAMSLDVEFLSYISRRHMTISEKNLFVQGGAPDEGVDIIGTEICLDVFDGKETPSGFPSNPTIFPDQFTLVLNKNSFLISVLNS